MTLTPEREQEIRERLRYPVGRTVMGLEAARLLLAEIDRLRLGLREAGVDGRTLADLVSENDRLRVLGDALADANQQHPAWDEALAAWREARQ